MCTHTACFGYFIPAHYGKLLRLEDDGSPAADNPFIDSGESLIIKPDSALVLRPYGVVVEQYSGSPLDRALEQDHVVGPRREGRVDVVGEKVPREAQWTRTSIRLKWSLTGPTRRSTSTGV